MLQKDWGIYWTGEKLWNIKGKMDHYSIHHPRLLLHWCIFMMLKLSSICILFYRGLAVQVISFPCLIRCEGEFANITQFIEYTCWFFTVPTSYPVDVHIHLCMIDNIERLGVARHFSCEIKSILDRIYRCHAKNKFFNTLRF